MSEKLYICSGRDRCEGYSCIHSKPHKSIENCIDGFCGKISGYITCVPYKPNEFNLKLEINNV